MKWTSQLASVVMELDRTAGEECKRFREFVKFLKYGEFAQIPPLSATNGWLRAKSFSAEIARNTQTHGDDAEVEVPSNHDVLLVCDYLDTAFLSSQIGKYLWSYEEIQSIDFEKPYLFSWKPQRDVKVVLKEGLERLRKSIVEPDLGGKGRVDTSRKVSGGGAGSGSAQVPKSSAGTGSGVGTTPALLSPMLRRGGAGAEIVARAGDGLPHQDAMDTSDTSETSDISEDADFIPLPKETPQPRPSISKPLWPMVEEVISRSARLLSLDGALNLEMMEKERARKEKSGSDWFDEPIQMRWTGSRSTEYYRDKETRYVAWISSKVAASEFEIFPVVDDDRMT